MKTKKKTKEKKQNKWWQKKLFEIIFKFNLYTHIHTKKTASFSETLISLRYFCFLFFCFWFFSYLIQNSFIQHTHTHTQQAISIITFFYFFTKKKRNNSLNFFFSFFLKTLHKHTRQSFWWMFKKKIHMIQDMIHIGFVCLFVCEWCVILIHKKKCVSDSFLFYRI